MEVFNELIKNFDKIRGYMRHFAVYGSKKRDEFTHKSSRTYDNERRRIQSCLGEYVDVQTSSSGKRLAIHFDSLMIQTNPFFEAFKTKSFTKNDIFLHFTLLDLMHHFKRLSVAEICILLDTDYLSYFEENKTLDARTIRLKLEEYVALGLFATQKEGKTLYYFLASSGLEDIPFTIRTHLYQALTYFQHVAPIGILGHFMLERSWDSTSLFVFPDLRFSHTLDEQILLYLLEAIQNHCAVKVFHANNHYTLVLPLKIIDNVEQGRRYVMVYQYNSSSYKFYRLDRISKVILTDYVDSTYSIKLSMVSALLQNSWGIALNDIYNGGQLETWSLLLSFDEETDQTYIEEIRRYTPTAILQRIEPNTYAYTFSILEAHEMTPWLRRFIGHILHIECTNLAICQDFIDSIRVLHHFYHTKENSTTLDSHTDEDIFLRQNLILAEMMGDNPRKPTTVHRANHFTPKKKTPQLQLNLTERKATYELFHKLYSKYYSLAHFILDTAHAKAISIRDIHKIVASKGFMESATCFTPLMTSQLAEGYQLLHLKEEGTYCSILKKTFFDFLTDLEKAWLRAILEDPKMHLFLEEEEYQILKQRLKAIRPLYEPFTMSYVQQKRGRSPYEDTQYQKCFKLLLKAIQENLRIHLEHKKDNGYTSSYYIPYKIQYHLKSDSFSLLAIQYKKDTLLHLIPIPLTHIQKVECLGEHHLEHTLDEFVLSCKAPTPITFWLSNKRSGFDRVLMYFSNYERTTTFDERTNSCIVQLQYYAFEEDQLIDTLLSFGPIIKVISPQPVVEKIKNKIESQYNLFAKFFS